MQRKCNKNNPEWIKEAKKDILESKNTKGEQEYERRARIREESKNMRGKQENEIEIEDG